MIHQSVHSKKIENHKILLTPVIAIRYFTEKQSRPIEWTARQWRIFDFASFHFAHDDIA
ncbi:MAG: hypothetical protein MUC94_06440 [bacterium]|nr:hypothetical protein [bacterium]